MPYFLTFCSGRLPRRRCRAVKQIIIDEDSSEESSESVDPRSVVYSRIERPASDDDSDSEDTSSTSESVPPKKLKMKPTVELRNREELFENSMKGKTAKALESYLESRKFHRLDGQRSREGQVDEDEEDQEDEEDYDYEDDGNKKLLVFILYYWVMVQKAKYQLGLKAGHCPTLRAGGQSQILFKHILIWWIQSRNTISQSSSILLDSDDEYEQDFVDDSNINENESPSCSESDSYSGSGSEEGETDDESEDETKQERFIENEEYVYNYLMNYFISCLKDVAIFSPMVMLEETKKLFLRKTQTDLENEKLYFESLLQSPKKKAIKKKNIIMMDLNVHFAFQKNHKLN
jgi:hypothetical protein